MSTALPPGSATTAARPRFYYGWWIVLGAMLAQFAAVGGGLQVAGVFLRPVTEELDWTSGQYALAGSIAFGVGGLMGFVIGPLIDRIGARPLMLVGGIAYGLALLATSRVNAPWQFILCQTVAGGFGQALSGPLVVNITLSKWFVIRRGWAIAMGSIGISMAGLIAPIGMTQAVDHLGWREGYIILGIVVAAVLIPVALIMRRQPEDYGLLPDGRNPDAAPSATNTADLAELDRDFQNSYTRAEAVRTPGVWLITIGMGFFSAAMTAVLVHGIPFMTDAGLSRTQASIGVAVAGLANLLSKFVWGWSLRRVETRVLFSGAFLCCGVGTLLMLAGDALDGSVAVMYLGFFVWGFGFGGGVPLSEYIWARYYGRRYIGAVRSVGVPLGLVFGSSGSVAVAWYFDAYGTYTGAFIGLLGCYLAGALTILASRQPPPKVQPPTGEPSEDATAPALEPSPAA